MSIYNRFKSIDDFKRKAEFIKKGSIIPRRVFMCSKRKESHKLKAGSDLYVIPTKRGYLVLVTGDYFMHIKSISNVILIGSPYHCGDTITIMLEDDFASKLDALNKNYLRNNKG